MSPAEPADANAPVDLATSSPTSSQGLRLTWILVIAAGLVAGLGSWGIVEGLLNHYKLAFEPVGKPYPTADDPIRIAKARTYCGTIAFGATGGLLGLLVGLAAGISRHSTKAGLMAGAVGLLIGGAAETAVAWPILTYFYKGVDPEDMLQTLLCHEALWVIVGIATGLALGLGLGERARWLRSSMGGLVGVCLGVAVFQIAGALAFPTSGTQMPIAESLVPRLIAHLVIPLGAAIGSLLAAGEPKPRKAKAKATV